jgi:hypothetical protein
LRLELWRRLRVKWWYLAFADGRVALVDGATGAAALERARELRCAVGGDARWFELPGEPPEKWRWRLLSRKEAASAELAAWGGRAGRLYFQRF